MLVLLSCLGCNKPKAPEPPPTPLPAPVAEPVRRTADLLSFEAFAALAYQEPDTGLYFVDGDIPVHSRQGLQTFYDQHFRQGAPLKYLGIEFLDPRPPQGPGSASVMDYPACERREPAAFALSERDRTEIRALYGRGFVLHTGTVLEETGAPWSFAVASNGDLFVIKQQHTGSHSTEVHVLSAADNYQSFRSHTATPIDALDSSWVVLVTSARGLMGLKKSHTETRSTEVHIADLP